jgi:DNA processing protein
MSKKMVNDLVDCGLTIVSGLATGIDTYAHRAAIDRNGNTIAVIAGGFDNIHPAINTNLSTNIASQGLLLSEYAPHIVPKPYMFVERNRIVSGLSHGVLVVEAGIKSGAMITANLGLEQGRNIYCVPGNVNSSQSMGTNQLIKQGAMLVTDGIEIARDLRLICESATLHSTQQVKLDFFEQQVYDVLMLKGKLSFDSLVDILQCNARELAVILTNMEIKSIIVKHPNNLYSCD